MSDLEVGRLVNLSKCMKLQCNAFQLIKCVSLRVTGSMQILCKKKIKTSVKDYVTLLTDVPAGESKI